MNISHSAEIRRKAREFKNCLLSWDGHPGRMTEIVERFSVGTIHDTNEYCRCAKEECLIAFKVREVIDKLLKNVKDLNRRANEKEKKIKEELLLNVIPVGSIVDGSKIFVPDEFDFLIVFEHFREPQDNLRRHDQISVVEKFRLLLVEAMQEMDRTFLQEDDLPLQFLFVDCELRRVCLNIRMIWRGQKYEKLHLSVDLTPVYQFDGWDDQHYGLRPLLPFNTLPEWYQSVCEDTGYFRPVYSYITVPPFTPIAENRAMNLQRNAVARICLRLLKMIVQTNFIIENNHAPNSYCLKLAFFLWSIPEENILPERKSQIAAFVAQLARRFNGDWAEKMPYFVTGGYLTTKFRIGNDLVEMLERHSYQPSPE